MTRGIRRWRSGRAFRNMAVDFQLPQDLLRDFLAEYWLSNQHPGDVPSRARVESWIRTWLWSHGMPEGALPWTEAAAADDFAAARAWADRAFPTLWPLIAEADAKAAAEVQRAEREGGQP